MNKTRILYVEDEQFLGKIVKESLESRGFVVTMVTDGNQVLPTFTKAAFDICILDIMLPGKDGLTIATEIKNISPEIPIIFLTAKVQTDDLVLGFKAGGNDYIKKPFSLEELIVRIENLLQMQQLRDRDETADEYKIRSFTFYPKILELHTSDQVIKLSHRENELLKLLVLHKKDAIERSKILQEIWGDDHFFNSRNLDVYITRLRNYLKSDPDVQIITLKGIGYRFVY
ncbi:MAG: response regulator transcription factor [Saprospiraceae bacterium]|nr:response regulator transcription factor [Saprospiraceae bacterium]